MRRFLISAASGTALVLVIAALGWQHRLLRLHEIASEQALRRAMAHRAALEEENARLNSAMAGPRLKTSLAESARLASGLMQLDRLRYQIHQLRYALGQPDDPVWLEWAKVMPAASWTFAGQADVADTLQSVLWAARGGDVTALEPLLHLNEEAAHEAQKVFGALPPQVQAQYGSPERFVAAVVAATIPDNYQAVSSYPLGPTTAASVAVISRIQESSGAQTDIVLQFQRVERRWQLNVPAREIQRMGQQE